MKTCAIHNNIPTTVVAISASAIASRLQQNKLKAYTHLPCMFMHINRKWHIFSPFPHLNVINLLYNMSQELCKFELM